MRARTKTTSDTDTKSARAVARRFASARFASALLAIAVVLGPLVLGPLAARAQDPAPPSAPPNVPSPAPGQAPPAPNEPSPVAPDPSLAPNDPTLDEPADPNADPSADPDADPTAPPSEPPDAPPPATLPAGHEPVIHVELTPDSGMMTGDVLTLTLRVTTPARDEVTIPRGQGFAPFEVLHRPTPRVEVQGDRATHVIELELLALEPGDHELPSITLRVVTADGVVGEVQTAPLRVPVWSVLGNEPNAEPKPPTEPVEVWEDDYTLAWVLGGLGLILFGALFAWLFSRWWSRRVKAAAPPPPPRPPWEVALEKLEALRLDRDAAVREERVVGWVDQVSDALREYLGRRYEFDGLESTTDEVVTELRKRKLIGLSLDEVIALLRDCDLVKFAKAPLGVEESDLLLAGAFRVVRTTAPIAGVSAMGPVTVGMSGPSGLGGPSGPGGLGGLGGPMPPMAPTPPSGDARWMGLPPSGATPPIEPSGPSTPWVPPPSPPTLSPTPRNPPAPWVPPTAPPAATVAPSTVGPSVVSPASPAAPTPGSEPTFDPSAPWTPPGATPSKPSPKVRAEDEWMPPSARLAPTFEPRLDPAAPSASSPSAASPSTSPSASPSAAPSASSASTPSATSGAVIAPAPVRSAVVPTTREPGASSSADVVAPTPVRSAVLPTTRVPETPIPETPTPETPGAASMEPAFPPTRPPAAEARPIPLTMPPVAPSVPEPPSADSDATLPETRLRTLVGFGDPERPTFGPAPTPTDDDPSREPEDPS